MRLYRVRNDEAVVAGVLAGFGDYFNVDPTILRIAFVLLVFMNVFPLIPLYILGAVIIPKAPKDKEVEEHPYKKYKKARSFKKRPQPSEWSTKGTDIAEHVSEIEEDDWSDF